MSYNIDTWKLKKLENLCIPMESFFKHERTDWHPTLDDDENGNVILYLMESKIKGKVIDRMLHVEKINISGEGSGTEMDLIVEPALQDSTGELIASCVWEGGDTINQLIVKDGITKWKDIAI